MKANLAALVAVSVLALGLAGCSSGSDATGTNVSQEAVSKGLATALSNKLAEEGIVGLDDSLVGDFATCVTDKSWDKLSDGTKTTLAKSSPESISDEEIAEDDAQELESHLEACVNDVIVPGLTGTK